MEDWHIALIVAGTIIAIVIIIIVIVRKVCRLRSDEDIEAQTATGQPGNVSTQPELQVQDNSAYTPSSAGEVPIVNVVSKDPAGAVSVPAGVILISHNQSNSATASNDVFQTTAKTENLLKLSPLKHGRKTSGKLGFDNPSLSTYEIENQNEKKLAEHTLHQNKLDNKQDQNKSKIQIVYSNKLEKQTLEKLTVNTHNIQPTTIHIKDEINRSHVERRESSLQVDNKDHLKVDDRTTYANIVQSKTFYNNQQVVAPHNNVHEEVNTLHTFDNVESKDRLYIPNKAVFQNWQYRYDEDNDDDDNDNNNRRRGRSKHRDRNKNRRRAQSESYSSQRKITDPLKTLDLHRYSVKEAMIEVENFLSDMVEDYRNSNYRRVNRFVHVITGRGLHSKGGIPKIKPAVQKYLDDKKYKVDWINEGGMVTIDLITFRSGYSWHR